MKLYFAGSSLGGILKIGVSKNPEKRIDSLTQGCPFVISLFAVRSPKNARWVEQRLHAMLANHRARGEWFYLSGPVAEVVRVAQKARRIDSILREAEKQASRRWHIQTPNDDQLRHCSFCGRSTFLGVPLALGEAGAICEECARTCAQRLAGRESDEPICFGESFNPREDAAILALEQWRDRTTALHAADKNRC